MGGVWGEACVVWASGGGGGVVSEFFFDKDSIFLGEGIFL